MPVLHSYVDRKGVYLRSQINGNPITFQVSPTAENVLKEMGYRDQSEVSWSVLHPLHEKGDIYTQNTGVEDDEILGNRSTDLSHLSEKQRSRLQSYIDSDDSPVASLREIKTDLRDARGLSMTALAERELETLTVSPTLTRSLENFSDINYDAQSINTPEEHAVRYEFEIEEKTIYVNDLRWDHNVEHDFKVFVDLSEGETQILNIEDGYFTALYIGGEQRCTAEDRQNVHREIYQQGDSLISIRELFFHLRYYDIRPDPENPGHTDLPSGSDLIDKHIWVTPEKYTDSSKRTKNKLVTCEFRNIIIYTNSWNTTLIEVTDEGQFPNAVKGEAIEQYS